MTDDILTRIVAKKREEVAARKRACDIHELQDRIARQDEPRGFANAIRQSADKRQAAVIAEMKKASPSRGIIREDFDPVAIAQAYEDAGATCLSVLTDSHFFQGADEHLQLARAHSSLPALRKDFILDDWQVHETRALGADCILLIAAILDIRDLHALHDLAQSLGLDVLVEVHDEQELDVALTLAPALVGINNRNLKTFEVSLETTLGLLGRIPDGPCVVTESGIRRKSDVVQMMDSGVYGFLVGEAFMRQPDPGQALADIFSTTERRS